MKKLDISLGTWLTLYSEGIAELLANAGYDWITIDLEHSAINISQAEKLIRVIDLAGSKPFVRVSNNDEIEIKRVLDAGAKGIIVPMVNSLEDVKNAIASINLGLLKSPGIPKDADKSYGPII